MLVAHEWKIGWVVGAMLIPDSGLERPLAACGPWGSVSK